MSWKVRHEGSPRAVEGLTAGQVAQGLVDGHWEPTDEVMGPDDQQWVAIENHQKATERQTTTTRWLNVVMTALTILMAVPTVVQVWRFAYSEIWPVVRLWRPW